MVELAAIICPVAVNCLYLNLYSLIRQFNFLVLRPSSIIKWLDTKDKIELEQYPPQETISTWGPYIWRGDLTEGFLRHWFGGLIFGGAYFWNFTVCYNCFQSAIGLSWIVLRKQLRSIWYQRPLRSRFSHLTANGKPRFAVSGLTLAVCPYLGLKIRG